MAYSYSIPHATLENPATSASVQLEQMHHELQQTKQMVRMLSDQLTAIGSLVQGRGGCGKGEAVDEWVCDRTKCWDEDKAAPSEPRAAAPAPVEHVALPVAEPVAVPTPVSLHVTPPESYVSAVDDGSAPRSEADDEWALFDEADDWPLDSSRGH